MIYGQQSVCWPASRPANQPAASQSVSESTKQPAGQAASRTSTACTIPCASAINAGIILIRSILGSGLAATRAPNFSPYLSLVARAGDGELSREERGKQAKGRQEDGEGRERDEERAGASY